MDRCAVAVFAESILEFGSCLLFSRFTMDYYQSNLKQYRLLNLTPTATTNKRDLIGLDVAFMET